jgi:hypothetical protein
MINEAAAKKIRKIISEGTGLEIHSVAFIHRTTNLEFAAIVIRTSYDRQRAEEFLTDPRCPFMVTRETPTRIFIEGQS